MWADILTKPLQGMAFKKKRAELMNCSFNYEENEERETTLHTKSLSERGKVPSQTSQECVGNTTNPYLATDRQVGVSRLVKRSKPPAQRKGKEQNEESEQDTHFLLII